MEFLAVETLPEDPTAAATMAPHQWRNCRSGLPRKTLCITAATLLTDHRFEANCEEGPEPGTSGIMNYVWHYEQ